MTRYQKAHLVPVRSGLTVAAPLITWSLMPSFGYGVIGAAPYSRARFVSFSQNSVTGGVPSGPGPAISSISPQTGWETVTPPPAAAPSIGRASAALEPPQDQVLRNQAVGSTCRVAASGPALVTEIVISRSSGEALA